MAEWYKVPDSEPCLFAIESRRIECCLDVGLNRSFDRICKDLDGNWFTSLCHGFCTEIDLKILVLRPEGSCSSFVLDLNTLVLFSVLSLSQHLTLS